MINAVEKEGLAVMYLVDETDGTTVSDPDHCFDSNLRDDLLPKSKTLLQGSLVLGHPITAA